MLFNYNLEQAEQVPMIKNWLDREGVQFIAALTKKEQDMCNDDKGLFEITNKKFKPLLMKH